MVIQIGKTLDDSLKGIGFSGSNGGHLIFPLHKLAKSLYEQSSDYQEDLVQKYLEAVEGEIPNTLKRRFQDKPEMFRSRFGGFCDDITYFFAETYFNVAFYGDYHFPSMIQAWIGESSFVLSVGQEGNGFDAEMVNQTRKIQNAGGAFNFFRSCESEIFFDNPNNARTVFMGYKP